jgi:ferrochelatase
MSVYSAGRKIGVVLFQLGGPDSLDAIEPFLYNLFSDPDIIDFPFARIARQPLARLIAATRARHVRHHYAEIGGRSPILEFTRRQARALEAELRGDFDVRVVVAMRYSHPFTAQAIRELEAHQPDEVLLLPLYPQYSRTTTGSSLNEWKRRFQPNGWNPRVHAVTGFHDDAGYIDALVEWIDESLAAFDNPAEVDMVFSAHSVPMAVIEAGDPYQRQIERTVELVWSQGHWPGRKHLCYQSKVGASKWLQPSMHATIKRLAEQGGRRVLVIPISFVSDHVETLHEIDIEHRAQAMELGIREYRMAPGLNDAPRFIGVLGRLVRSHITQPSVVAPRV